MQITDKFGAIIGEELLTNSGNAPQVTREADGGIKISGIDIKVELDESYEDAPKFQNDCIDIIFSRIDLDWIKDQIKRGII